MSSLDWYTTSLMVKNLKDRTKCPDAKNSTRMRMVDMSFVLVLYRFMETSTMRVPWSVQLHVHTHTHTHTQQQQQQQQQHTHTTHTTTQTTTQRPTADVKNTTDDDITINNSHQRTGRQTAA